jgi:acetylornithine/succinyldiaminopimelate/putrescine aminotransferase
MAADGWNRVRVHGLWRDFVNPDYVQLLETFDFGRHFVWAQGTRLRDDEGREYTDFLAGYGVHNIGHNHPCLVRRLRETLEACGPSMLNVDAPLPAGLLARQLCQLTHPDLCRVVFASSGAETAETAIKAARAATGRNMIVVCHDAWHGLTTGTLSLRGDREQLRGYGALLADVVQVPFGDAAALERVCTQQKPAAFFVEPIQGEGGMRIPEPGYLTEAGRICRKAGCLLVVDEIQTGLGRTGTLFATDFAEVRPDLLLVGKALSGGLVPVAACLMTARVWSQAFSGPGRCHLCASTFGGGRLAMEAGLETLRIVADEQLAARAQQQGRVLLAGLQQLATRHAVIREVRGLGLMAGVEFQPPHGLLPGLVPRWARQQLFAQVVAAVLLRDHGLLTQPCGLAPAVLRIEPPLVIAREEIEALLAALDRVLAAYPSHTAAVLAAMRKTVLGREL